MNINKDADKSDNYYLYAYHYRVFLLAFLYHKISHGYCSINFTISLKQKQNLPKLICLQEAQQVPRKWIFIRVGRVFETDITGKDGI